MCDLVRAGEEILGVGHNDERAARWRGWWSELTYEQPSFYRRAAASARDEPLDAREHAGALIAEADALIVEILKPGQWPQARTVKRFLADDRLERVLALYVRAMRLDPAEPAYPWNLGSTLNRLGINDLALGFVARAIHLAEEADDPEWAGADALLALAEVAVDAAEPDIALTAIARAQDLDERDEHVKAGAERLLSELRTMSGDPLPQVSLARRLLSRVAA